MPQPDAGDVHVDRLLTNIGIGWNPGGHIADEVFPRVPVDKQSDIYLKYGKSAFARDESSAAAATGANNMLRAPGAKAAVTGFNTDLTNRFYCPNYAIGWELPDEVAMNADNPIQLERAGTILITNLQRLARDRKFVADFMKTSVWGTDATISAKWNDYGASSPIEDMRTQLRLVRRGALATPGGRACITMGALVWDRLADHPDLLDRIKYTERGIVAPDLLASLLSTSLQFPVDVKVGLSVFTADEEGTAEASVTYADVWDDDVLFTYRPPGDSANVMFPSSGYTFVWAAAAAGGGGVEWMRRIREERERVTVLESHGYWDQVATDTTTGVFLSDAVD